MSKKLEGVIVKSVQDGFPIVWAFENCMPEAEVTEKLSHLVVILWEYDKTVNNGMPSQEDNARMLILEDALEAKLVEEEFCRRVSSSTGNGRKEFCFYVADTAFFMTFLNEALIGHERYPIDIKFYEDPNWEDFQRTLDMLN